jgi:hypothetical protein
MIARSGQNAGFMQSAFQRELAEFVGFIGGADVDKVIRKVEQKLRPLPANTRSLFGDRFFFHEQFTAFTCGPLPFQLDTTDLRAVRAASLIAGVNRVKRSLSSSGALRLRAMLLTICNLTVTSGRSSMKSGHGRIVRKRALVSLSPISKG